VVGGLPCPIEEKGDEQFEIGGNMPREIVREDGSRSEHIRESGGDHRVRDRDAPADGGRDRVYGSGHSEAEVREKEKDKSPKKE
jgi:hypothetical protein